MADISLSDMDVADDENNDDVVKRDPANLSCLDTWFYPELDDGDTEEWEEIKVALVLHPDCKFRRWWELLSMILIVYSCITIPYRFCFLVEAEGSEVFVDYFVDGVFMIDGVMTFRLARKVGDLMITSPAKIASLYAQGWLLPDFMSSFPFDAVLGAFSSGDGMDPDTARLLKIIRIFHMVKILRMVRIKRLLKKLQDDLGIKNGIMISIKVRSPRLVVAKSCPWNLNGQTPCQTRNINSTAP